MQKRNCFQDSLYPTQWKIKPAEDTPASHDFRLAALPVLGGTAPVKGKAVPPAVVRRPAPTETLTSVPELSFVVMNYKTRFGARLPSNYKGLDPTDQPGSTYW